MIYEWNEKKIKEYGEIRRKELGPIYAINNLPINDPQKRLEFLSQKLGLGTTDPYEIEKIAEKNDKSSAFVKEIMEIEGKKISRKITAIEYCEEEMLRRFF